MAGSDGYRADSPISVTVEADDYYDYNDKDDPKRRISDITATSVSSFPDSAWPSDSDLPGPFYSSAKPRPAFRVGSLRRSPLPERLSPSSLRPPKHTSHRPRSRDEHRRPRSRGEDVTHHETLPETPAPLVLLHITVLPPRLPWNRTVLDATLPPELKRQFGVLRAATSGLVAQRGILIAHPREEFELLEESVLEALDLLPERIGYDGQYRPRTPNTITEDETDDYNDEAETPICKTCQRVHVGDAWYTRVYAANGLMRAGAWGACWSEMERVDVEVRPCISEHICRRLDEMQLIEDTAIKQTSHYPLAQSRNQPQPAETPKQEVQLRPVASIQETTVTTETQSALNTQLEPINSRPVSMLDNDLPPIYQPKDVPLRLLLRNYFYLVLRDRRNVAIFFLALSLLASTFYGMVASQESVISASKAIAVDESPIPPAVLPRIDVGHGKRHPMWKQEPFEPQEDGGSDEHFSSSNAFEPDRRTEQMSTTVAPETTVQLTAAATTSVAATSNHISTQTTITFSSNPAYLPLLHGAPQCLPKDQQL
jgi:hypothetical protein